MDSVATDPAVCREKALKSLGELPPFSPILNKLMASLASDKISFVSIAELIEKDTVLAGNVLRLVNSALYGRRGTISSVRHAVSLMGLVKLRNTVMTLSVARIWSQSKTPKGWSAIRFNLHAVATAVMADLLVQKAEVDYPEGGFVAGLLHDVGFLLLGIAYPEEFAEIRHKHLGEDRPIPECERIVLGLDHAELSALALRKWNLPEPIQRAVRYQFEDEKPTDGAIPLSRVVHVAEQLIDGREITLFDSPALVSMESEALLERIGLADRAAKIDEEFDREFEPMKSFF